MSANQSTELKTNIESLDFLSNPNTRTILENAADTFIKHVDGTTEIWAASRDWFLEEWGRDTFICLPGLLLSTKRFEESKQVFQHFAGQERNGLIPNVIKPEGTIYNTADASLLFIYALKKYYEATQDSQFLLEMIPIIRSIISGYLAGTGYDRSGSHHFIGVDPSDGLVTSPSQATWMDADPSGVGSAIITPRNGKCVEINALWYNALLFANDISANQLDDLHLPDLANKVKTSFEQKFWIEVQGYLSDVVDGDPHGSAFRPNQLFAISLGNDLIGQDKQLRILENVLKNLVTPGGLRTLSPHDPKYIGNYDTTAPMSVKDLAYHQGTIWPWLIGPFCDALVIVRENQGIEHRVLKNEIGHTIAPLVQYCLDSEFKSLPELFAGNPPFDPGGTTSQGWSIAEVLRILTEWF